MIGSKQPDFGKTVIFARNPRSLESKLSFFELSGGKSPAFKLLRELEEYSGDPNDSLSAIIDRDGLNSNGANKGNPLALNQVETTLKDLVLLRVHSHLNSNSRESVLARDVTKFCNQICA